MYKFLYDRSAKLSDSIFYQNNSLGSLNHEEWMQIYDEMYYEAHDTLSMSPHVDVENISNGFSNDTIPIGIMDYDWYYCANNSLSTNVYFNFDTVNNLLYDKPGRPGWPFGQSNIFAVSPLRMSTQYLNPTFRIDPNLFFKDIINSSLYSSSSIVFRIDFGDGTGWHNFNPNVISHFQTTYADTGVYHIKSEVVDSNKGVLKYSFSFFSITGKVESQSADEVWDMPGMNVGVFHGCNDGNEKVIIYLEGIDVMDFWPSTNRGVDVIYQDMIEGNSIRELQNFGYTYYVVDWKNSRIDMRFNALHLVNLIEKLKSKTKNSDEQFVIIGESMGGLVGRYAMTFMESRQYLLGDFAGFFVEAPAPANSVYLASHPYLPLLGVINRNPLLVPQMHKTRELITLDTPHQGANVPISIQVLYTKATTLLGILPITTSVLNMGLGSYAAKQMLIYHMDGKTIPLSNVSGYLPAPQKATFFAQLKAMGNYPKFAKLMALSNGALNGTGQLDANGNERVPGDVLFHLGKYKEYKLFGNTYPLFDAHLDLFTNPDVLGTVLDAAVTFYVPVLKVKLFGVSINAIPVYLLHISEKAFGVKPHCVSAGGNLRFDILNQVIKFGFIPVQSALDYDNSIFTPLDLDIENENINTKLSKTPFDVFMGYTNGENWHHLFFRDELIYNITRDPAINCSDKYIYFDADQISYCNPQRSILNLEIGDEEMYIENWILNRKATFEAEYDVRVNERNPYYEYPSFLNGQLNMSGIYSKEKQFFIAPIVGEALFLHNAPGAASTSSFSSIGFTENNLVGKWSEDIGSMGLCFHGKSISQNDLSDGEEVSNLKLRLYPNPTASGTIWAELQLINNNSNGLVQLLDPTGKMISEWQFRDQTALSTIQLNISNLQQGLYFVRLIVGDEQVTQQLIIN